MRPGWRWLPPAPAAHVPAIAEALGIPRTREGTGVALTFDDGPHPSGTPAVLKVLADHGATATFFVVGEQVRRAPHLLREIAAAGHTVALHGDRHRCQLRLTPRQIADDLDRAADVVGSILGAVPRLHRPPYGVYSRRGLDEVRRRAWTPMLWSRWGRDWTRHATPEAIARRCTHRLTAGDVVLLHDADHYSARGSWIATVQALLRILSIVQSLGHHTVALHERRSSIAPEPFPER